MRLNITLGIQTPIYTGHCNCNGFIWFMSKWDLCLLTAMNSPLSRIRQPAQSDTLKYTPTMNISHLETNTTESIDSIYILCTAQWLKRLPQLFFFFSSSLPAPFQCNYCQPNQYSMHFIELTKDYWVHGILENFIFPRFLPLCLLAAWLTNTLYMQWIPHSFAEKVFEPKMQLHVHLWLILRRRNTFSLSPTGGACTLAFTCVLYKLFLVFRHASLFMLPYILQPLFYSLP